MACALDRLQIECIGFLKNGMVAQSVEQQPFKLMVAGSIPAHPTILSF